MPKTSIEARIAARAKQMWEADGSPAGQQAEFAERARELLAIEDNPGAGQIPVPPLPNEAAFAVDSTLPKPGGHVIEEADIQDNLGEFPGPYTDQGDREQTPHGRGPRK
jgi:hypothetical protein